MGHPDYKYNQKALSSEISVVPVSQLRDGAFDRKERGLWRMKERNRCCLRCSEWLSWRVVSASVSVSRQA